MTNIFTKETPITWKCPISRTPVLICLLVLWFSLTKAQPDAVPILNLGPLYDCSQPRHLGIFGFPSLKNCSHSMLKQNATVTTFRREVPGYSPVATTFLIYYCTLETIAMTCHYDNIFAAKSRYRTIQSVLLPGRPCLQAGFNYIVPIGHENKTLIKVNINYWEIPVTPTYDCSYSQTVVNKYHNFQVRTYKAQLVGAANVIEQHLTNTLLRHHSSYGFMHSPRKSQSYYRVERPSL